MKKILSVIISLIMTLCLSSCTQNNSKQRYETQFMEYFDTITQIVCYTNSKNEFEKYSEMINKELEIYHQLYDIYNDYDGINNIKTINDNAGIVPVKVDKKIIDMLTLAKQKYKQTNGAVNIAMGSVLEIWHNYREEGIKNPENAKLPPMEMLENANTHTNIENIIINEKDSTVFINDKDMRIDAGSIGKGYAAQQICNYVKDKGLTEALISVGGNVCAIGGKGNDNSSWNVGIKNPDEESNEPYINIVKLKDLSLVTSGDYQRFYTVDGTKYHHIINGKTLMPSDYFTSVSIICKSSADADALSTAVFNMPLDEGLALINSLPDTEAVWVLKDKSIKYSNNFKTYIKE